MEFKRLSCFKAALSWFSRRLRLVAQVERQDDLPELRVEELSWATDRRGAERVRQGARG